MRMIRPSAILLAGLVIVCVSSARLYFDTDNTRGGTFLEYPKPKNGAEELPEDSYDSSPICLIVCDGVSSGSISSKYISEMITLGYSNYVNNLFITGNGVLPASDKFFADGDARLEVERAAYGAQAQKLIQEWETVANSGLNFPDFSQYSSTTFIAATLTEEAGKTKMLVHQKGDSLLTLFRRTAVGEKFVYLPVYMTNEMQHQFNMPHQFNSHSKTDHELYKHATDVIEFDMAVIGSDGLFDNLSLGFMSMAINDMMAFPKLTKEAHHSKLIAMARVYYWMLKAAESYLHIYYTTSFDEKENKWVYKREDNLKRIEADKLKGEPDPKMLEAAFKEAVLPLKLPEAEVAGWKKYFSCHALDIISLPEKFDENPDLLNACVQKVIKEHFGATKEQFAAYTKASFGRVRSDILCELAYYFSHLQQSFPSVFSLREWNMQPTNLHYPGSGKPDDITAIAGVIVARPDLDIEKAKTMIKSLIDQNLEEKETWMNKLVVDMPLVLRAAWMAAAAMFQRMAAQRAQTNTQSRGSVVMNPLAMMNPANSQQKSTGDTQTPKKETVDKPVAEGEATQNDPNQTPSKDTSKDPAKDAGKGAAKDAIKNTVGATLKKSLSTIVSKSTENETGDKKDLSKSTTLGKSTTTELKKKIL